jgi:hypothetical protein
MSYDDKVIGRKKKEVINEEHSLGSGEHSGGFKNVSTAIMDELSIIDSSSALYRELAIAILNNDEDRQALLDSRGFQSVVEAERYIVDHCICIIYVILSVCTSKKTCKA